MYVELNLLNSLFDTKMDYRTLHYYLVKDIKCDLDFLYLTYVNCDGITNDRFKLKEIKDFKVFGDI